MIRNNSVSIGKARSHLKTWSPDLSAADVPDKDLQASEISLNETVTRPKTHHRKSSRSIHYDKHLVETKPSLLTQHLSLDSPFFGIYTLAWMIIFMIAVHTFVDNYATKGYVTTFNVVRILNSRLALVAFADLLMYASTYVTFLIHLLVYKGYISWNWLGIVLQNIWQAVFLGISNYIPIYFDFPWTGRVFIVLHSIVLLMKQYSYAFYSGYLSETLKSLKQCQELKTKSEKELQSLSLTPKEVHDTIADLTASLKSYSGSVVYPDNVTLSNFFMFSMYPTVVYYLEYPRTKKINWNQVFLRVLATFGVMGLMIFVAEESMYDNIVKMTHIANEPLMYRIKMYPILLIEIVPSFAIQYLLSFYIIWEAILNAVAELTRFADRRFYGYWWNSVSWDEFARNWNVPVHLFLLRHVYHSSISVMNVSKQTATLMTFFLSSCIHELVMFVIFQRVRGYLLILQMTQLPLVALSRTKFMKDKKILGNIIFWLGIFTGPSLMCTMYLTF
ncbi:hypothetical protein CANCADRAFT_32527 [Tortispora caseinolytica NRRL Y-17796]|uniref:O-acyltransferase n=1 Tax=Tortispora caseinolytica NRRL Y-17796 TaxID=767744 RepID=A0A1E4TBR6_9ASCO|nr:hypothetical protein CANCADRAFT_32527 [Tortispora caseinolytica NRRL Y-17796]